MRLWLKLHNLRRPKSELIDPWEIEPFYTDIREIQDTLGSNESDDGPRF